MEEQASQDIQGLDNPASTGSQSTRRPQRWRGNSEIPYPIRQGKKKRKSPHRLGNPDLLRDHEARAQQQTLGVTRPLGGTRGVSSEIQSINRVESAQGAVITGLLGREPLHPQHLGEDTTWASAGGTQ
ncbi:hypothetical protein TIFTF001_037857 [Ficus carica]|uniref:Uncharacterized protein n=1 Tax=Ficus carica TaxID=3494 RepID=A0AA88E703_FICCA|nr:hypothetical protein TIFTF001_037857 [Ficus carica]